MKSHVDFLVNTISQKDKIINYLKKQYKIEVGNEIEILDEYISIEKDKENEKLIKNISTSPNSEFSSFELKINSLNLPNPLDKNAKVNVQKLRKIGDDKILIKHIDLSHFVNKNISSDLLKRLIDGLKVLKSVESIDLSYNSLNDSLSDHIVELFLCDPLKRISIKRNDFGIVTGKKLVNIFKNTKNYEYIDLSYNPFNQNESISSSICVLLKGNDNLFHLGINDSSKDAAVRLLTYRKNLRSLIIEDNKYKTKAFESISNLLCDKRYTLSNLSLKFSNIDVLSGEFLGKIIKFNKSLISLNLGSANISDICGKFIISNLSFNNTLVELQLDRNKLGFEFSKAFGTEIAKNRMIKIVDISNNININNISFDYIVKGLMSNQSLLSIGDINTLKISIKQKEIMNQILKYNIYFNESQNRNENESILVNSKSNFVHEKEILPWESYIKQDKINESNNKTNFFEDIDNDSKEEEAIFKSISYNRINEYESLFYYKG